MVNRTRWAAVLVAVVGILVGNAGSAHAATWSSTDKWGTWSNGGYTVRNNVWGSGVGPQTIWANSYGNWGVWADHPNTGGVKSYPHSARNIGRKLSGLSRLSSSFNVTRPGSGAYATAYDIWADNHAYEVMIWVNKQGAVGPIGARETTASVGGHTWDVHRGSNGSNQVFSFVRTGNTNSGTVDVLAVLRWIGARGWYGDVTIGDVQFGFEVTSSPGGMDFRSNSFSITT
ncbi:glycoside hydrolase family 12 protein [Saccharothrix xinjiangensis]|uniref:Glycosyl hydrolase family 12 n=1 Tax=Saccharothrix xinjiangensis TaxID=204798 RepID=A0ABV9Y312_9PSEU